MRPLFLEKLILLIRPTNMEDWKEGVVFYSSRGPVYSCMLLIKKHHVSFVNYLSFGTVALSLLSSK